MEKKAAEQVLTTPVVDPALPFKEITVEGKVLRMCLNYRAMALAESKFHAAGHRDVYLLVAAPDPALVLNLQYLFACSLHHFQPDLPFEEAIDLLTPDNQVEIFMALKDVLSKSMVKAAKPDPPPPAQ